MSAEENKALVRRYIEVVWNQRNTAALDELLAPTYQRYVSATATPLTSEGQRQRITGFHIAFPDLHFTIEDLFAEGDRVTFRATLRGTHQGPFPYLQGMAPTGKQVTISVLDVVRVEAGKFAEQWEGLTHWISSSSWELPFHTPNNGRISMLNNFQSDTSCAIWGFSAETEKKLKDLASKTGRETDAIVEDVMASYFDEMQHIRETLGGRYDEITSGRVQPVDGEQFFEGLRRREEDLLNSRAPRRSAVGVCRGVDVFFTFPRPLLHRCHRRPGLVG